MAEHAEHNVISPELDKSFFSVSSLADSGDEKAYWQAKSCTERLAAMELTRQILYGYDPSTTRLQKFFEVVELPQC